MRVLELGSYLAPAYAGMLLAEQSHQVMKWTLDDPIHSLSGGDELWRWVNHGKSVEHRHARDVPTVGAGTFHVVIDNFRAATWQRWGIDPRCLADDLDVTWVSLRADDDERSFDVIAQARAWGDKGMLPFYIGDTAAGLWLAFKALAAPRGHHVLRQAAVLAKLVEGELVAPHRAWDPPGTYGYDAARAFVDFKGERVAELRRDDRWRASHLPHRGGRYTV